MTIREWISNPIDFKTGLELYKKYSTRPRHVKLIENRGDIGYNRADLIYELSKLQGVDETSVPAPIISIPPTPAAEKKEENRAELKIETHPVVKAIEQTKTVVSQVLNEQVEALRKKAYDLKNEAAFIKSQIFKMESKEERCAAAHKVLDMMDKVRSIWDKIDYHKEHGHFPEVITPAPAALPDDPFALSKRLYNLRTYISRNKNPEKIAAWKKEMEEITEKLKSNKG
jgi:hypothetical protein